MAVMAECDEVLFAVLAGVCAKPLMMYFETRHSPAELASPAVTLQDETMQVCILLTF